MTRKFIWPLVAFLIFSCAKKPEYDTVYKVAEQTNRFKDYDTDSVYVYVPSTLESPRKIAIKEPFFQGNETLVKLKWEKEGLSVYAPDREYRFDFSRNQKPIFTIPGSYKAYRCATNNLGECTNREEADIETPWDKRPYFVPNLEGIDFSRSYSTIDIFHDDGCIVETNSRLKDYLIKKGVINIEMEREFRVSSSIPCLNKYFQKINKIEDLSFKGTFFYSLVRLKDLRSPDYKTFVYPRLDQKRFGYFKNTRNKLDKNFRVAGKEHLLNRWNPKKDTIIYHLSDAFNRPDMKIFKEETYKAVNDINIILEKADVPFSISLKEPSGKKSGDLRYNMVVIIPDPLPNLMLGYGPTVKNPITGEIIQGHINMYAGALIKLAPSVYGQMVRLSYRELDTIFKGGHAGQIIPAGSNAIAEMGRMSFDSGNLEAINDERLNANFSKLKIKNEFIERLNHYSEKNGYHEELYLSGGKNKNFIPGIKNIKSLWQENNTLKNWDDLNEGEKKKVTELVIPHMYRTTFIHEFGHNLGLRHNFMGSADRNNFYNIEDDNNILPNIFNKSDNPDDFRPPQYSSIMDYGYSDLNELPIFGKYDIAALRYGYARKFPLKKNSNKGLATEFIDIDKVSVLDKIRDIKFIKYKFCTDGDVYKDILCNRHDEGATYTDIMKHYKLKYEDLYYRLNFRNGRQEFSRSGILNYYWYIDSQFRHMRDIFEEFELKITHLVKGEKDILKRRAKIAGEVSRCKARGAAGADCEEFLDLYNASVIAGKLFVDVVKTPEHMCVTEKGYKFKLKYLHWALGLNKNTFKDKDEKGSLYYPTGLSQAPKSCFDKIVKINMPIYEEWNYQLNLENEEDSEKRKKIKKVEFGKIVAERGRYIVNHSEYNEEFRDPGQISVRGIWPDKALAMEYLFARNHVVNRVKDAELNFMEHPEIGPLLDEIIEKMFTQDEFEEDNAPEFTDEKGEVVNFLDNFKPIVYSDINNPVLEPQSSIQLRNYLDLPFRSKFYLNSVLINMAAKYLKTSSPKIRTIARKELDIFRMKKIPDHILFDKNIYSSFLYGEDGFVYAASYNNILAKKLIQSIMVFKMFENDPKVNAYLDSAKESGLEASVKGILKQIYGRKTNPYNRIEKRILALGAPLNARISNYLTGFGPNVAFLGQQGGLVLEKIIKMADKKLKLNLSDFNNAFGEYFGPIVFPYYSSWEVDDLKKALDIIGGEIDAIYFSISDLEEIILLAKKIEASTGTIDIDSLVEEDDTLFEEKKFVLSRLKSKEILEIKDWMISTSKVPEDFYLKELYEFDNEVLKKYMEILETKDEEELEHTLKSLPSY